MATLPPNPIFSCAGNRTVAVNPDLVRSVEADDKGRVKIVFDRNHEISVKGSLLDVIKLLWKPGSIRELEATVED